MVLILKDRGPLEAPASCGLALKEWAGVCSAFLSGRQTILLRKGGVDDPAGPWLRAPAFWLFPTHFHEPLHGLRPGVDLDPLPEAPDGFVDLPGLAQLESIAALEDESDLDSIRDAHVMSDAAVLKRFRYRKPGLLILGVRILVGEPRRVPVRPEYAGCKSWVDLDPAVECGPMRPVLDRDELPPRQLIRRGGTAT